MAARRRPKRGRITSICGAHSELWYHAAGCHAWLVVTRDLRSHEILAVQAARDVALGRES
jgi:sarcosine oxidase subunit delta